MSAADDIWNDLFGGFESLNRRIEDMFSQMDMTGPDVKTYGYTMYQGPDGVRHVKEFGNSGSRLNALSSGDAREFFTDVTEEICPPWTPWSGRWLRSPAWPRRTYP